MAHAITGSSERITEPAGSHRLGDLLPTGPTELAGIAFDDKCCRQHGQEAEERQGDLNRQGDQKERQTGEETESRPLDVAEGVTVQRGLADFTRELRIARVELLLYLVKDALFVFRERHRVLPSAITLTQSSHSVPGSTTRSHSYWPW